MGLGGQGQAPGRFTPGERPGTDCIRGRVDLSVALDECRKDRLSPGFDPRTVRPVASRYSNSAKPALNCTVLS